MCTASGDTRAGGSITFAATNAAPSSFGGFVFGNYQANIPIPFPGACPQHVTPFVFSAGLFFTSAGPVGSGTGSWTFNLGPGLAGIPLTAQAVIVENGSLSSIVTSVAVETVLQ